MHSNSIHGRKQLGLGRIELYKTRLQTPRDARPYTQLYQLWVFRHARRLFFLHPAQTKTQLSCAPRKPKTPADIQALDRVARPTLFQWSCTMVYLLHKPKKP